MRQLLTHPRPQFILNLIQGQRPLKLLPSTTFEANIPTAAVGLITEPDQAEHIITTGEADAVFLARAMLRNPRWALMASEKLDHRIDWALPLERGRTV
jgi:2,4-dienoyl-CoA reductase-like NADH-dependent reductase (Old Yellow Enzyme family)